MNYKEARRLIDNKIWTRDELKRLEEKLQEPETNVFPIPSNKFTPPWHKRSTENTIRDTGTILFDLT